MYSCPTCHSTLHKDLQKWLHWRWTGPLTPVGHLCPLHNSAFYNQALTPERLTFSVDMLYCQKVIVNWDELSCIPSEQSKQHNKKENKGTSTTPTRLVIGSSSSCPLTNNASNQRSPCQLRDYTSSPTFTEMEVRIINDEEIISIWSWCL